MDTVQQQIQGLRMRLRLQTLVTFGVLVILTMAAGGADLVAKSLVEAPAWKVATKNLAGSASLDRLVVTTDADIARVQIQNANLELAQQSGTPPTTTAGALWYDSANGKLKYRNSSSWVEPGATPPAGAAPAGVFGRLEITGTTSTTLNFKQYQGDYVDVNGQYVQIGAGKSLTTSSTLLANNNGSLLSGTMTLNTTYYIYISNAAASPAPSELRASTIPPIAGNYNGVKYLNNTGNGANWRFLGWARTNASTQFENSEAVRFVINYYNRIPLKIKRSEATVSWNPVGTTGWRPWHGLTANRIEIVANGEDDVYLDFTCTATVNYQSNVGIGEDKTDGNDAEVLTSPQTSGLNVTVLRAAYLKKAAEGYHYLQLMERSGTWSATFYGTTAFGDVRSGALGWIKG